MTFSLDSFDLFSEVVALYEKAFSFAERRTSKEWESQWLREQDFHVFIAQLNTKFAGFIAFWDFSEFIYVEHLAVCPQLRGKGIGEQLVKHLQTSISGRPLLLEVEPPVNIMSHRRIAFYHRLGFNIIAVPYMQPPYRKGETSFPLLLMATDTSFFQQNFVSVRSLLCEKVYRHNTE